MFPCTCTQAAEVRQRIPKDTCTVFVSGSTEFHSALGPGICRLDYVLYTADRVTQCLQVTVSLISTKSPYLPSVQCCPLSMCGKKMNISLYDTWWVLSVRSSSNRGRESRENRLQSTLKYSLSQVLCSLIEICLPTGSRD